MTRAEREALRELVARELAILERKWRDGCEGATLDGLAACSRADVPLPTWLAKAVAMQAADGISKAWRRRYREDQIDMYRAELVDRLKADDRIREIDVYEVAAAWMEGTAAGGSAKTIENAVSRYRGRAAKDPSRYYVLRTVKVQGLGPRRLNKPVQAQNERAAQLTAQRAAARRRRAKTT